MFLSNYAYGFEPFTSNNRISSCSCLPTYFTARRGSTLTCNTNNTNSTILYDMLESNGNDMNATTGVFTAPKNGVYVFSFQAVRYTQPSTDLTRVYLKVNGNQYTTSLAGTSDQDKSTPVVLYSTILLNSGDKVSVGCNWGKLYSTPGERFTIFSGYLLQATS